MPKVEHGARNIVLLLEEIEKDLGEVTDKIPDDFIENLKEQLEKLKDKGELLREGVDDILGSLDSRRDDYREFVGLPGTKCSVGTRCDDMREDFIKLLNDMAGLSDLFPMIKKTQLGLPGL